jgi:hypothetical protein
MLKLREATNDLSTKYGKKDGIQLSDEDISCEL